MKVFVTGATGYIGGSIATALMAAGHRVIGLVHPDHDLAPARERGIEPVAGVLDDSKLLTEVASNVDGVINAANVDHRGAVDALLEALKGSNKPFIQTSGSGVIADGAGGEPTDAIYSDDTPLKVLPARAGRAALNEVVLGAASNGIRTAVILPTMVYGTGTGLNPASAQVPQMIKAAKNFGEGKYVGRGLNRWSNVHIEDLADLYVAALERSEPGKSYYAENGECSMREIAEAISRLLGFNGTAGSLSIPDAIEQYGELMTTLSFGSNSRVRATRAHDVLGWGRKQLSLIDDIVRGSYAEIEAVGMQ
jgi:nucleoside-diphosphate-sugar epimerase